MAELGLGTSRGQSTVARCHNRRSKLALLHKIVFPMDSIQLDDFEIAVSLCLFAIVLVCSTFDTSTCDDKSSLSLVTLYL